jgi:hypothetical protein
VWIETDHRCEIKKLDQIEPSLPLSMFDVEGWW